MRQQRHGGYDVNGWRDTAARNWIIKPGGEIAFGDISVSEGSPLSSVVRTGDEASERWIGGVQADLAPHGRGGGWGQVGAEERRRAVCDVIEDGTAPPNLIGAALAGLAPGATHAVVAIEDLPTTTERQRERMLAAIKSAKIRNGLLVWRPVLAVLHALEAGCAAPALVDGATVGVIGQGKEGLSIQTLRLRREIGRARPVLAPERRSDGELIASEFGLTRLADRATRLLALQVSRPEIVPRLRALGRLALGLPVAPEIVRLPNGHWEKVFPPLQLEPPVFDVSGSALELLRNCDAILLEAPCEGLLRDALVTGLQAALDRRIEPLAPSAVAEGALVAATRLAANEPIYFDFLPRISTIVQGAEGATNYDLIRPDETLPAGRLYRSPQPARLAIQAGQSSFSVHLRKEAEDWPRKAVVDLGTAPDAPTPVDLWVEQSPAAGRARIVMQAPELSRQFTVNWDNAEELKRDWTAIIEDLATPLPTIPKRLVLPCGMQAWDDSTRGPGLITLLADNVGSGDVDWSALATQLRARPEGRYCISSDGDVPAGVPSHTRDHLDALTSRAERAMEDRFAGTAYGDNMPFQFLTWQFRRCPEAIARAAAGLARTEPPYPLFSAASGMVLLFQGLGRIVKSEAMEREVLKTLLRRRIDEWNWRRESACAAFILSRSDSAPLQLERRDVERLAKVVRRDFELNIGTEYTRFNYAPFLLVGLLRWRLREPRALVAGQDPVATGMARLVETAIDDFENRRRRTPAFDRKASRYLPILRQTLSEIQGAGTNPDLLLDIYGRGED